MKHLSLLIQYEDDREIPKNLFKNNEQSVCGGKVMAASLYDLFECYGILEKTLNNLKSKASIECECEIDEAFDAVKAIMEKK